MKVLKPTKPQLKFLARHLKPLSAKPCEDYMAVYDVNHGNASCQEHLSSGYKEDSDHTSQNEKTGTSMGNSSSCKSIVRKSKEEKSLHLPKSQEYSITKASISQSSVMFNMYSLNSTGQKDLKRFLEEVGTDPKEARYWLKQFQRVADPYRPFAVIQVENEVIHDDNALEQLASCLSFLHRHDMKCVIVHGSSLPEEEHISCDMLKAIRQDMSSDSIRLANILELHGTLARPLFGSSNIVEADLISKGNLQGTVHKVNTELIKWALGTGHTPIIQSIGECETGQMLHLNVSDLTAAISKDLTPLKVMFVNNTGGFTDHRDEVIANINIPNDLENVYSSGWCTQEIKEQISYIGVLLNALPAQSSVVITSTDTLLTELFTHHGSGTIFKITEPVKKFHSLKDVDVDRLVSLIHRGFGKTLLPNYLDEVEDKIEAIYVSEGYSAAAIIAKPNDTISVPYLDKFVICSSKQGDSMGQMLWEVICQDFKQLFWRSRNANMINQWYFKRSEGSWTNGNWTVFWYGVPHHKQSSDLIDYALNHPSSFASQANSAEMRDKM